MISLALLGSLSACSDEKDLAWRRTGSRGVRAARQASDVGSAEPDLAGMPRPQGGGAVARILVQAVEVAPRRTAYVWALYLDKVDQVREVRRALLSARPATFRTCPPVWRLDVRYGHYDHVAWVNVPCRRLVLDGKELVYGEHAQRVIGPILRLAVKRPDHKLFPVKVPVAHDSQKILSLLGPRAMEAFLPERPARRGPVARVTLTVQERPPPDPRHLDETVAGLRSKAYDKLMAYAQQLKTGRKEILDVIGPEPIFERFGERLFEARYGLTVLFRHGTPEYMLGFLGLGGDLMVEKITIPKDYRADLLFPAKTTVADMKKALEGLGLEPSLSRY